MNNELSKMIAKSRDPRFICGIYNYCDRWCEKCTYKSRCQLYSDLSESANFSAEEAELSGSDLKSNVNRFFTNLYAMIDSRNNMPEYSHQSDSSEKEGLPEVIKDEHIVTHPLVIDAECCFRISWHWFSNSRRNFLRLQRELTNGIISFSKQSDAEESFYAFRDATEVISWYSTVIITKMHRSVVGMMDGDNKYALDDAKGSCKTALISIDQTIEAWQKLEKLFPERKRSIQTIIRSLYRLRQNAEDTIPGAREFVRPGFDDKSSPVYVVAYN